MTEAATAAEPTPASEPAVYRAMLYDDPAPPREIHPLLRYLADVFTAMDKMEAGLVEPGDSATLQIEDRIHLKGATMVDGALTMTIRHPPAENGSPGPTDTYGAGKADELLRDVAAHSIQSIEARSAWQAWTKEPHEAQAIRIALRGRGMEGYYVYTPLDSDGIPYGTAGMLRFAEDEPDGEANIEIPLNLEASLTLEQIHRAIRTPA